MKIHAWAMLVSAALIASVSYGAPCDARGKFSDTKLSVDGKSTIIFFYSSLKDAYLVVKSTNVAVIGSTRGAVKFQVDGKNYVFKEVPIKSFFSGRPYSDSFTLRAYMESEQHSAKESGRVLNTIKEYGPYGIPTRSPDGILSYMIWQFEDSSTKGNMYMSRLMGATESSVVTVSAATTHRSTLDDARYDLLDLSQSMGLVPSSAGCPHGQGGVNR